LTAREKFKEVRGGFTLVELLVVIAIIGVLAVVLLIAINPAQQLARTRDAGRKSAVTQVGHSLEAYATSHNGVYVAEGATWIGSLVTAGEISTVPSGIKYTISGVSACTVNAQNDFCYDATTIAGGSPAIVYARLESQSELSKCASGQIPWVVYSTADGRGGTVCTLGSEPAAGSQTFVD